MALLSILKDSDTLNKKTNCFILVEPDDGVQVEVVGGFVQHQQSRFHEESSVGATGEE